jgi:chemotaxis protein MotA
MEQMFVNMTDPSELGTFMAVALLTTFYGAALANLLCVPIADKGAYQTGRRGDQSHADRRRNPDYPRSQESPLMRETLLAYLLGKHCHSEDEDIADEVKEPVAA